MPHLLGELGKAGGRWDFSHFSVKAERALVRLCYPEMESLGSRDGGVEISGLCPTICCRRPSIHSSFTVQETQRTSPECTAAPCLPSGCERPGGVPPYPSRPFQAGGGPVPAERCSHRSATRRAMNPESKGRKGRKPMVTEHTLPGRLYPLG